MLNIESMKYALRSLERNMGRTLQFGVVALLALVMCGCAGKEANASNAEPEVSMLEMHLISVVEDVQTLGLAIQFADSDSENSASLSDLLNSMLGEKLNDLAHFLSQTENKELEGLTCRVLKKATKDVYVATNSCTNTELCEKAHHAAQVCVAKGYITEEEAAIPEVD